MSDKIKREWIVWVAKHFPEVIRIAKYCSAPDCENVPVHVCINKYNYFLCEKCAELVNFEKRYAAYERKSNGI